MYVITTPLLIFLLFINFTICSSLSFFDAQRVSVVSTAFLLSLIFSARLCFKSRSGVAALNSSLPLLVFGVLSFLLLAAVLASPYPIQGYIEATLTITLLISCILLSSCFVKNQHASSQLLVLALLLAFVLYYLQFLVSFFAGLATGYSIEREVLVHHFSNVRFVNHLQVLSTPLLIFLFVTGSRRSLRVCAFSVASIGVAILLFCSARAATGCLLIGFVLAQFLLRFDRAFFRASLSILASGVVIFAVVFKLLPVLVFGAEVQELKVNLNSSGRWDLWVEAIFLINENWLLGIGPQHYSLYSDYGFAHPHNLILQLALDYGVVVTGLLMSGLFWFGFRVYKTINVPNGYGFEKACAWALISIFGTSLFSGVWVVPMTQLGIVLLAAPLVAVLRFSLRQHDKQDSPSKFEEVSSLSGASIRSTVLFNRLFGAGIIAMACTWGWLVGLEVQQRINALIVAGDKETKMIYAPRFWQYQHWVLPIGGE